MPQLGQHQLTHLMAGTRAQRQQHVAGTHALRKRMRRSLQPTHLLRIGMLHRANQIST